MSKTNRPTKAQLKKIELLILDVDGVLTDGRIVVNQDGGEIKVFDVQDGFGIVLFHRAGFKTAILSARRSRPVDVRGTDLKIDKIVQNAYPKTDAYDKMLAEFGFRNSQVCYIGDDLPDLPVIKRAGIGVTVPDCAPEVRKVADYITKRRGGRGAVREVVEMILKAKGLWNDIVKEHS